MSRTSAKSKVTKIESDTLVFAKAINKLTQKQDEFKKIVEEMKELKAETLMNIQLELKTKREELDSLKKEFETKKKDLEIKVELECKEYGYKKALEILEEHGEIAVNGEEYNELKASVENVKDELHKEMVKKVEICKAEAKKTLTQAMTNKELEHKAEIAMLTATVEQLKKERNTYESTISSLKSEIAAQRELTKQVAEASKQGAISQTFGK